MLAKKFPASRSLVCRDPEKIIKKAAFLPSFYRKIIVFCKLKIVFFNAPHILKGGGKGIKSMLSPSGRIFLRGLTL